MIENAEFPVGSAKYRALGFVSNPFRSASWNPSDQTGTELIAHAATARMLTAIDASLVSAKTDPIWASGEPDMFEYFGRLAVSEVLYSTTGNDDFGVLAINIPFPLLSIGRIRSALGVLAERLAGVSFDETLGRFAAAALAEFDGSLPEAAALTSTQVEEFRTRFAEAPAATSAAVFGGSVPERQSDTDIGTVMQDVALRQDMQSVDPDAADETVETDTTTETPIMDRGVAIDEGTEGSTEETRRLEDSVRDYLIAHARAHVSPVVARGLLGYVTHGTDRLAQELKVTKAPRKTMKALCKLATYRFRGVAIIYDDFDSWPIVPDELRASIAASMSELRWALKPMAVLAFVAAKGSVPELEEQFSVREIDWSVMDAASTIGQGGQIDEGIVRGLVDRCSIGDGPSEDLVRRIVQVCADARGDLEQFVLAAGRLVDDEARSRA